MNIEYFKQLQAMDSIEIEDIGNCSIEACNDSGAFWYLIIKTNYGMSEILEYGPIVPDINELPNSVICDYSKIEFMEGKLKKIIDMFLNNGKRQITQAREISKEEALNNCKSLIEYMEKERK